MADARRHIRNAVVASLSGITAVGGRIYNSRVWPHPALPSLAVFTPATETLESWQSLTSKGPHDVEIVVESRAAATSALENALDALDAEVEAAVLADTELASLVMDLHYMGTERLLESAGPQPVGLSRLRFSGIYNADVDAEPAPAAPTFSTIVSESGPTAINLGCATNRLAIVRFRLQKLVGGVPTGAYYRSIWEAVPKMTGHLRQVSGLTASTTYRAEIEINAVQDPDLAWASFTAAGVGPDFTTADSGTDPTVPGEQ